MRARKNKRQHNDSAAEQRARVLHRGSYDGTSTSQDFVVSGHSTGSPYSEMEGLSHQVSLDAGKVPDYQIDEGVMDRKPRGFGVTAELNDRGAMGSPDLYGPNPPLTGSGDEETSGLPYRKLALWSSLGLVTGALGFLAYKYYGESRST
jgi:hypothetical protein